MLALPVLVTVPVVANSGERDGTPAPRPAHHKADGTFQNPWESYKSLGSFNPTVLWHMFLDWQSRPIPPPEQLPQVITPTWGHVSLSEADSTVWRKDIKATWLGHACFLVEFPHAPNGERGPRVLFDPVFTKRHRTRTSDPSAIYDHTDVTTLKHIYGTQAKGTVHFFAPLGNKKWFESIGFASEYVTELDWWEARGLQVSVPSPTGPVEAHLRITATPCQHFTGRSIHDRYHTLWASWAVEQVADDRETALSKIWFGGDTGFKSVPRGATSEEGLPTCPAFKEIGEKFGSFDFSMIPIGAYDPRWFMSRIHCSPEDSVELHLDVKSKKSVGIHWGTWILTSEEMTEPPKRLRSACEAKGITKEEFDVCDIGETVRITPVGN
ncbi:hypothetical protein RQP46_004824 [Phenoliferia psychrophenolica]